MKLVDSLDLLGYDPSIWSRRQRWIWLSTYVGLEFEVGDVQILQKNIRLVDSLLVSFIQPLPYFLDTFFVYDGEATRRMSLIPLQL